MSKGDIRAALGSLYSNGRVQFDVHVGIDHTSLLMSYLLSDSMSPISSYLDGLIGTVWVGDFRTLWQ